MNNGRWNYPLWGYPENPAVASGVEFWAWMAESDVSTIDERWIGLSNALAGLFCASLSALPQSRTTVPIHSFRPEGQLPVYTSPPPNGPQNATAGQNYVLRHAVLPSESICTENLTPFIKLLPCKSYAGLAELLNPHKIFSGWWYGVGIHATWHDGTVEDPNAGLLELLYAGKTLDEMGEKARGGKYEGGEGMKQVPNEGLNEKGKSERRPPLDQQKRAGVKVRLTVGTILDPPQSSADVQSWSLENLFGKNVTAACPVFSTPDVRVRRSLLPVQAGSSSEESIRPLVPEPLLRYYAPGSWVPGEDGLGPKSGEVEWDLHRVGDIGMNLTMNRAPAQYKGDEAINPSTPLTITRSLRGFDQTRGAFSIVVANHLNETVDAWYMESVPWIIKPYLSSLKVEDVLPIPGGPNASDSQTSASSVIDTSKVIYHPPKSGDRTSPTLLEIPLRLPSRSFVYFSFEFEKKFLKYTEHPPDAQRGWDLPGGVLIPVNNKDASALSRLPRMYTTPLLADLATPDFSMPYNVILLSGSLLALLFGMTFNMLTRRFVLVPSS
ncbi:Subunit of the glycosylphosphatidylinositol transamidase complex-like protein [Serendipita sp. 399]|nr:Subunit of the glycosylphosphatidylinositol transamidase complex-like protein [Serendipita sp. 399]